MTISEIAVAAISAYIGYGLYNKFMSVKKTAEIHQLDISKAVEQTKVEDLKAEQTTLKEEVTKQEADKSDKAVDQFWKDYAEKNPVNSPDSK